MTLKEKFYNDIQSHDTGLFEVLVTAVELPTGAIEIITNTMNVNQKVEYIIKAYNEEFELNTNNNVKIVGYMLI
jgi:hypothetical protein